MKIYSYSDEERTTLEKLLQPLAVRQLIGDKAVTLLVSDGFCRLFGFPDQAEAVSYMDNRLYSRTHPDDRKRLISEAERFAEQGGEYNVIFRTLSADGSGYRIIHAHASEVRPEPEVRLIQIWYMDEGSAGEGTAASGGKLSLDLDARLHEENILHSSRYDELTGLPNLSYFFKMTEESKYRFLHEGRQGSLLYIDLDGMKLFNHRYGFAEGDRLLKAFADLLIRVFGRAQSCRITADRFAACTLTDLLDQKIRQLFDEAKRINGGRNLPVLVGVYSTGFEDVPVSTAYDRAKLGRDEIRRTGESSCVHFSRELSDIIRKRQYIQANIDRAISEKWIKLYCQAIVRSVNEKVCDEEALARWVDPAEGFLSPADFIPSLERAGLVYKLDLYMLDQVLEKIKEQERLGMRIVPHSINLSRSDFDSCDIVGEICRRVDDAGIRRSLITIEITESVVGNDPDFMKTQIERFRELGFPVWMDDFGTGYSSLHLLQTIRFDLIKFDMSFMKNLHESESTRIILTELMKMACSLGVDTVCEGVETEEQVRFLQEIGCSRLQGFYYSKPMPAGDIIQKFLNHEDVGFEDPLSSSYYEAISRISLYNLDMIASVEASSILHAYSTMPIGVIEVLGDKARFTRANPSYRDFIRQIFGIDVTEEAQRVYARFNAPFMYNIVEKCTEPGSRTFFDEKLPDGSVVHSFARMIGRNRSTGEFAVAVAVLSVSDPAQGDSYAEIARALASDYYNIYVVDLDTDNFIEYTSAVGRDDLAVERHGEDFFSTARRDIGTRVYEEDREFLLTWFTRDNIIRSLNENGVLTSTYRLIETGVPLYVSLKITRLQGTSRIILGVSVVDSQMRRQERIESDLKKRKSDAPASE